MPEKGRFIVVEGLEGAGKSTALATIKHVLERQVPAIITTREPGGTRVGEVARQLIKESSSQEPLDSRAELLLLYASRVQLIQHIILPALNRGDWVLADRFELSTWAYQGGGRKLSEDMIQHLSSFCLQDFKPDLIIFLDISPQIGLKRARMRSKADRIEKESLSFFTNVYHSYHERIKTMSNVVVIDASKPLRVVHRCIEEALKSYLQSLTCLNS